MKTYMKILGLEARDKVTGFTGVVTSVCFDLYGCVQVVLSPSVREGKLEDSRWFDFKRVVTHGTTPVMPIPTFEVVESVQGGYVKALPI